MCRFGSQAHHLTELLGGLTCVIGADVIQCMLMDTIIMRYFVEIYDREPTDDEWIIFRAGFYAGMERERECPEY